MTERSSGSSDADDEGTTSIVETIGHRLTGTGGVLFVTFAMLTVGLTTVPTAWADIGDRVVDGDDDHLPILENVTTLSDYDDPTVCRISEGDSGKLDDAYYLHWGSDCSDDVSRDDIRLTESEDGSAGEVVQSGDDDLNQQFETDPGEGNFLSNVGYIEADGWNGFTAEDWVYFSANGDIDASNGDIRLTDTDGGSPGELIDSSSDSDLEAATDDDDEYPNSRTLQGGSSDWDVQYYDADGDGDWDADEEPVYLTRHGDDDFVTITDISLSGASDDGYGDMLDESNDRVPHWLFELQDDGTDAHLVSTEETDDDTNEPHLFIHFDDNDGDNDAILPGDIALYHSSASLGDRVTDESDGAGEQIDSTTSLEGNVFYLDTTGSGDYTPDEDPVYLNRPSSLGGRTGSDLSADDVRLTEFESFSAGSLVGPDDSDLTSYGGDSPNPGSTGEWTLMLFDEDRTNRTQLQDLSDSGVTGSNGEWDENVDGAYVSSEGRVSDGDTRLYTSQNLANTDLSCVDGEANNGDYHGQTEHEDCGTAWDAANETGALANVPALNSTSSSFSATDPVVYDTDDSGDITDGDDLIYHPELQPAQIDNTNDDHDDLIGEDLQRVDGLRSTNRSSVAGNSTADTGGGGFSPRSDFVYHDANGDMNITDGDVRVYADWSSFSGGDPGVDSSADCANDADFNTVEPDCDTSLENTDDIKVSGADGEYEPSQSEYVYQSKDDILNDADYRFLDYESVETGADVAMGDEDVNQLRVDESDRLYLSWCVGSSSCDHPTNRVRVGDIRLGAGSDRIGADSSEYDVELSSISASDQTLKRYDRGSSGQITDDTFYLGFGSTDDRLAQDDIRLLEFEDGAAGTNLQSGDSQELSATVDPAENNEFAWHVNWTDVDGDDGYTDGDPVYVDLDTDIYSSASKGTLRLGDLRLTEATASGNTYEPGTMVRTGDSDQSAYSYESSDPDQGSWTLYWHDADRDDDIDDDEQVYVNAGTQPDSTGVPNILSVRLTDATSGGSSSGGSSGGGGGGGGGGGTTQTPPSISISSPSNGDQLDPGVQVSVSGTASGGSDSINSVSVTAGGDSLTVTGASSWSTSWTTPEDDNGTHTITATVTDSDGETSTDTVDVTVGQVGDDADDDGVLDENDNCPDTANADQADLDDDGTGDACDEDRDGDGLYNDQDECRDEQGPIDNNGCPRTDGDEPTDGNETDGGEPTDSDEPTDDEEPTDGNETDGEEPEETPAAGLVAVLLAGIVAVTLRKRQS